MAEAVIEIEKLTKNYRRRWGRSSIAAVKNLSMRVNAASIVAFVGPHGAGKTTTIHTLLGFLKPDEGAVRLFGKNTEPAFLSRVGYEPEVFNAYPFYKAHEVLRYYGRLSGMSSKELDRSVPRILDRMGLADVADRRTATFSKGMMQRLGLAQALLHDPDLLILDEPTSGLDPDGRRLVLDLLGEEKQRGRTVFLSSHILSDVERTCDEVFMIRQGEIVYSERLSTFSSHSPQWEIEILAWKNSLKEQLAAVNFTLLEENGDRAVLLCAAEHKRDLLHRLTELPVDIGTVRRRRGASLEDVYMKYVGRG